MTSHSSRSITSQPTSTSTNSGPVHMVIPIHTTLLPSDTDPHHDGRCTRQQCHREQHVLGSQPGQWMGTRKWPGVTAICKPTITPPHCLPSTSSSRFDSCTYDRQIHTVHDPTPHAAPFPILYTQKTLTTSAQNTLRNVAHTNGNVAIPDNQITDVYLLDNLGKPIISHTSNPFLTIPSLHSPSREQVCFLVVVDNGAMINVIDTTAFQHITHRLNPLSPFSWKLRMANRSVISSTGT